MDNDPSGFILNHLKKDLKQFEGLVHRTFNSTDICEFVGFLQRYYSRYKTLEDAFYNGMTSQNETVELGMIGFKRHFEDDLLFPKRSLKHIASPDQNSACKRLNMFLRWMVRKDDGVDFGIWQEFNNPSLFARWTFVCSAIHANSG
jgi:uncharacterized protein (TIGR02757 family)|tara:strand:+ start:18810 stop:19247 length:438 start_codon:yes stop_codon:yes gene_type:complete